MSIDPAAILAVISDLTSRLGAAEAENAALRQALAERDKAAAEADKPPAEEKTV